MKKVFFILFLSLWILLFSGVSMRGAQPIYSLKVYTYSGKITKVDVERQYSILFVNNRPFLIHNYQYHYFLRLVNRNITVSYTIYDEVDVALFQIQRVYGYWES